MKKLYRFVFILPFVTLFSCSTASRQDALNATRDEIIQVMRDQEAAWNRGDMQGFMAGYAQSDSTLFAGKSRVNYGWQTVLDGYLKAYPDKAAMGKLQFDLIRVVPLSDVHAYVVGKWTLIENEKPASGHFVLIFEKSDAGWRIIVDGTS
ncbi:MAG: YybH family protein [Bacteroidia bacterium]